MRADEDPDPAGSSTATLAELGERGLVARFRRRLAPPGPEVLVGIGDDAAAVAWGGETLLLTTDALLEGVHFRRSTATLRDVGAKAIAVNVSDIAAMGGEPRYALLALALPPSLPGRRGRRAVRGDPRHGAAPRSERRRRRHVRRASAASSWPSPSSGAPTARPSAGAAPGPGTPSWSPAPSAPRRRALALLEQGPGGLSPATVEAVARPHRLPTPRVAEGRLIRASGSATAMIDLSDGLVTDLGHIAAESRVGARIDVDALPVERRHARPSPRRSGRDPLRWALSGGEDYELLFTAAADRADEVARRRDRPDRHARPPDRRRAAAR